VGSLDLFPRITEMQNITFLKKHFRFIQKWRAQKKNIRKNIFLNRNNLSLLPNTSYNMGQNCNPKKILFITDALAPVGGVETRLKNISKNLSNKHWEIFFLTEENLYTPLKDFRNFTLKFRADNLGECIFDIVCTHKIDVVEFQFKYSRYLRFIDIKKLRLSCVVGCTVSAFDKSISHRLLKYFDYRICVSNDLVQRYKKIPSKFFSIIYNCIDQKPHLWSFKNQKTAIHISRMSDEYIIRISGFVEFCRAKDIPFEIAGDRESESAKWVIDRLQKKYKIPDSAFIGSIDTLPFLKENISYYLFVAGCGHIGLEAGCLGIPVFITSSTSSIPPVFLTPDNINYFIDRNFTIREREITTINPLIINSPSLMEEASICIHKFIMENRNLQTELKKYQEILNSALVEKSKPLDRVLVKLSS
jgi:hypothetical protein